MFEARFKLADYNCCLSCVSNHDQRCGKAVNGRHMCQECVDERSVDGVSEAISRAAEKSQNAIVAAGWLQNWLQKRKERRYLQNIGRKRRLFLLFL